MSESDKDKANQILTSPEALQFMSSEESDDNFDGTPPNSRGIKRKVRKLPWERTKLKNIKATLDRAYESSMTPAQQRASGSVRRSEEFSERLPPAQSPRWAVRET